MPTIPLPQTPQVQRAAYGGARPADRSAEFQGQMALGAGLTAAGDAAQRFALASQQAKNAGDLAKSELAMRKAKTDIALQMEATANPDEWEEIAQRGMEAAQTALFEGTEDQPAPAMAPAVRRQVEAQWGAFQQDTLTNVTFQAARARNKDADLALTEAANVAYMDGNAERGDQINGQRVAAGLITEAQGKVAMRQGRHAAAVQNANQAISSEPALALDALREKTEGGKPRHYKDLDDVTRRQLITRAREQLSARHAETSQAFDGRIDAGEVVTPDELAQAVEQRDLTPSQARRIESRLTGNVDRAGLLVREVELTQRINAWNPADADSKITLNEIAADMAGLPDSMTGPLRTLLRKASEGPGGKESGPDKDVMALATKLLNSNQFGNQRVVEGTPENPAQWQEANETFIELRDALARHVERNPGISAPEQHKFVNEWVRNRTVDRRTEKGATGFLSYFGL